MNLRAFLLLLLSAALVVLSPGCGGRDDDDSSAADDDDAVGDDDDTIGDDDDTIGDDDDTMGDDDTIGDDDSAHDDDDSAGDDDDTVLPLQCAANPNPPEGKLVFLSSTQPGGNLGGVAGADALCQALATTASLPGTFMAWLSDSASSPADRFTRSHDLPYVRVDGAVVAANWNDLTDGALNCPIDKSELGQSVYLPTGPYVTTVFSNTLTDGNPGLTSPQGAPSTCYGSTTCHCYDWTSDDSTGSPHLDPPGSAVGSVFHWTQSGSSQVASDWTDYSFLNGCGLNSSSIYCFEQ